MNPTDEGTLVSTEAEVSYATIRILALSCGTGETCCQLDGKGESKYYEENALFWLYA